MVNMFQGLKERTARDFQYLARVRALPCVVTHREGCEAHHIIGHGQGGMGMKASDYYTFPLSHESHQELHRDPKAWEEINGSQWMHVAQTLTRLFA